MREIPDITCCGSSPQKLGFRGLRILNCRCRTGCARHNGCTAFFNGHNNYPCRILLLFRGNHLFDFFDDARSVFNCVLQSGFHKRRVIRNVRYLPAVTATEWMMMVASAISCAVRRFWIPSAPWGFNFSLHNRLLPPLLPAPERP